MGRVKTPDPLQRRFFIKDEILVRSRYGNLPCFDWCCTQCRCTVETTVVGWRFYVDPEFEAAHGQYLILHGEIVLCNEELRPHAGLLGAASWNLGTEFFGQRVGVIPFSSALQLAPPRREIPSNGLFCAGPCKNFVHGATADSDPKAEGNQLQWWCRSCRQDSGWMRAQ